jgi:uncharacterized membrane protein YgcG
MLSARSGISTHDMRSGQLREEQYHLLHDVLEELRQAPVVIDDSPGLSVTSLRTRARRMVAQHGVRCIFIDYLQLMSAAGGKESRQVEVSAISRGIKALARELNIPVVCLSQLNRGPESRGDNRPRMSDLRESGSIEQDADVVILIHREAYYHVGDPAWDPKNPDFDPANEPKLNKTELIIAKQRNGPTDVVDLVWDPKVTRFRDAARYGSGGGYGGGGGGGGSWSGGGGSGYVAAPVAPKPKPPSSAPRPPSAPFVGGGAGGGYADNAGFADPFKMPVHNFSPGTKTGPVSNFRDGGGPDRDDNPSTEPPPFDESEPS